MDFASRLTNLRNAKGVSQRQIAKDLGCSLLGYQRYEYNQSHPNIVMLGKIADYFGVSADYLLGRSDKP